MSDKGSTGTCPHCAMKPKNQHSARMSGLCDGIRNGKITDPRQIEIIQRMNNRKGKRNGD